MSGVTFPDAGPNALPRAELAAPTERPPRVLYADDEEDVREVFAAIFEDDFDVTCVATGQEALDALASREFDVLVSRHAHAADERARSCSRRPTSRTRMRSGSCSPASAITTISRDAVNRGHLFAYMQKPWDNAQLRLVIRRAAAQRRLELENRRLTNDLEGVERAASRRRRGRLADRVGVAPAPARDVAA